MTVTGMTAASDPGRGAQGEAPEGASTDLASIFLQLQKKARSGTLRLIGPDGQLKYVYFQKGVVELVKTSKTKTLLGRALLKRRMLTEPQLQAALERQAAGRHQLRLGQILVGMGIVPEAELMNALRFQIAEEVLELFTWSSVRSDFIRGDPPLDIFEPEDMQSKVALKPE
ncbi:hypothetical protein HY251_09230, partial [bacterium]|nr:hypothetical protein [bacterium]